MATSGSVDLGSVRPETRYATADDGVSIAYQTIGDGPLDLVLELETFGNVEIMWELPALADLFERLASFSRLIIHDRRGTGLSGGRGAPFPNIETRARDLRSVLDSIKSARAVLLGERTAGAAFALFAATYPHRVSCLAWFKAVATRRWSPDYPWARTPEELRAEAAWVRSGMGGRELARAYLTGAAPSLASDDDLVAWIARHDRHFMAPSTSVDWITVEGETDVTAILPVLRCPTLVLDHRDSRTGAAESRHVHRMIPGAELTLIGGEPNAMIFSDREAIVDAVRAFATRERHAQAGDRVLRAVLFTDIVASTERQASIGDRPWREIVERHHAVVRDALDRSRGVENDTAGDGFFATFDGPARAVRCAWEIVERVRDLGIEVRAGIHLGECEVMESKHAGVTVTIGSRIASLAGPSEVLVSRTVRDLVAGSGFAFEDVGERDLKGVPDRWQVYRVVVEGASAIGTLP